MISRLLPLLLLSSLPAIAESARELRVMCWNLHHGVGEDGKLDLERIAARIREQKPDLVVLQEVDNKCRRSQSVDQAAELGKLAGMTSAFGKAMDHDGGEYGQAILSKHPLGETTVHRLPGEGEPRIAFEAEVKVGEQSLRLVGVHLDHQQDARRLKQAETLVAALSSSKGPLILGGDFNDVPDSAVMKLFGKALTSVEKSEPRLTCPADKPKVEIDHFFLRGMTAVSRVTVLPEAVASDHRPLVMTVRFGDGE
ncbi:endonuclease/exonuclease/phosphatase family protein [Luteolibacter flavescens]|uniref:Endonuclease/exonuclease/phosphatase family protein n=1 Tax=Luteolibacter flavescens TaxID=1859460 RepID=A0ABT3FRA5_9BACT|nr:endonuclease/exonuclease/phosphatase family protein [Luteolibacter flavescens]MCW1886082.1 endonuclease/exonuclease/phosphatase family protein [Luteolibacter flavescens]